MKKVCTAIAYILVLWALLVQGGAHNTSAQSAQNRAGLVVQYGDGSVQTFCVAFSGETITGFDLLIKSGLDVKAETYGGLGGLVCKIGAVGCDYPGEVCACKSFGPEGIYWGYYHLRNNVWKSSSLGSGGYNVHSGEVDGWAWSGGKAPAVRTFDQICGVTEPQPTGTPRPVIPTPRPPTPKPSNTHGLPTARSATPLPVVTRARPTYTSASLATTPTRIILEPRATGTAQILITVTPKPPRKTPTRQTPRNTQIPPTKVRPTATLKADIATISAPLEPTVQPTSTGVPTPASAKDTPTPPPTAVPPTSTMTRISTVPPTGTSTPIANREASPTPTSQRVATPLGGLQPRSQAETAQTVSIAIVTAVAGGLLVWGGIALVARRAPGKRGRGPQVD